MFFYKFKILKEGSYVLLFALLISFSFCSCVTKTYTPTVKTEFETAAQYRFGEFTFSCKITKTNDCVTVNVLDTSAEGLVIKCDGANVTFVKDNLSKSFDIKSIDVTNPAVVLWEVFSSLESADVSLAEDAYIFSGVIGAGNYNLSVTKTNEPESLSLESADVYIKFNY